MNYTSLIMPVALFAALSFVISLANDRDYQKAKVATLTEAVGKVEKERDELKEEIALLRVQDVEVIEVTEKVETVAKKTIEAVKKLTVEETDKGDEIDLAWEMYLEITTPVTK